jgi:sorting nexin-1/2
MRGVQWFERQRAYLDSLESQLRGLVKAIDTVSRHRAGKHQFLLFSLSYQLSSITNVELAVASGEFAQAVSDLSSSDVGKQLSSSLAGLAEVEEKAQEIQTTQAEQDMETLMSTGEFIAFSDLLSPYDTTCVVDEYARLINSVRVRSFSQP